MQSYGLSALAAPRSREHYVDLMQAAAEQVGASRFVVIRLHGSTLAEVSEVAHSANADAEPRFNSPVHWSVARMLDTMRKAVPPVLFGTENPGLEVPGYEHGVAAIARERMGACVVYLGLDGPVQGAQAVAAMMATAQLSAQLSLAGLARVPKPCPLSRQELDCLKTYISGTNAKDAARSLGISARTVEAHLARARIRCGVDSTLAAARLALNEGWIEWPEIRAVGQG